MSEILNVKFTLGNGEEIAMKTKLSEDWSEIKKDSRAIINLINGITLFVSIQSACEDEGVAFKVIGGAETAYHYESSLVTQIFTEQIKDK
jgi:hypothetical protein